FPELGVLRCLAGYRVSHDCIAKVVDNCCDGECATEPLVQARFLHALGTSWTVVVKASHGVVDARGGRSQMRPTCLEWLRVFDAPSLQGWSNVHPIAVRSIRSRWAEPSAAGESHRSVRRSCPAARGRNRRP